MQLTRKLAPGVLVLALAACGGGGDTPQAAPATSPALTPATSAPPSPTPTPTMPSPTATATATATASKSSAVTTVSAEPTQLTMEEAAATYLRLAKSFNTVNIRKNKLIDSGASGLEIARATGPVADANFQFGKELRKVQWPDEVAADIDQLADLTAKETPTWRRMAQAKTRAEYDAASQALDEEEHGRVVAIVRQKLDLGEAPQ